MHVCLRVRARLLALLCNNRIGEEADSRRALTLRQYQLSGMEMSSGKEGRGGANRSLLSWMKLPLKMQKRHNSNIDDLNNRNTSVCTVSVCICSVIYSKACEMSNFACCWLRILLSNNFLGSRYAYVCMCERVRGSLFCLLIFDCILPGVEAYW